MDSGIRQGGTGWVFDTTTRPGQPSSLIDQMTVEAQARRDEDSAAVRAYAAEHGLDSRTLAAIVWSTGREFVAQADEFDGACDKVARMLGCDGEGDPVRFQRAVKLGQGAKR